eukprot:scaffold12365_cov96-Phaeocystis_antarctica.AAC.1
MSTESRSPPISSSESATSRSEPSLSSPSNSSVPRALASSARFFRLKVIGLGSAAAADVAPLLGGRARVSTCGSRRGALPVLGCRLGLPRAPGVGWGGGTCNSPDQPRQLIVGALDLAACNPELLSTCRITRLDGLLHPLLLRLHRLLTLADLALALHLGAQLPLLLALDPQRVARHTTQMATRHALEQPQRVHGHALLAPRQIATPARLQSLDGCAETDLLGAPYPRAPNHRSDRGRTAELPQRPQPTHLGVEVYQAAHCRHTPTKSPEREQSTHLGKERGVKLLLATRKRVDEGKLARLEESLGQAEQKVRPAQIERRQQSDAKEIGREPLELGRGERLELRLESLERQTRAVSRTQQSHLVQCVALLSSGGARASCAQVSCAWCV